MEYLITGLFIGFIFGFGLGVSAFAKDERRRNVEMINHHLSKCHMTNGNFRHVTEKEQVLYAIAKQLNVHHEVDRYNNPCFPYKSKKWS